jgi:hypothetical protein
MIENSLKQAMIIGILFGMLIYALLDSFIRLLFMFTK